MLARAYRVFVASAFFALALSLAAAASDALAVVDESGAAIRGAEIELRDSTGTHQLGRTDAAGRVALPEGLAGEIVVRARGYEDLRFPAGERPARIVLTRALPTVGNVSVATGANESLHRLPVAASNLDRRTLALSPASTSDGVLRSLAGNDRTRSNSAFTAYGQLRLSFSGAGTDRGSMFVDGVPAQDGFGGQVDWAAYPVSELSRVELLRDGGSALYGSGGIGGVLAAQTFGPSDPAAAPNGSLDLAYGNHFARSGALRWRGPLGPRLAASFASDLGTISAFQLPPGHQTPLDTDATSTFVTTRLRTKYAGERSSFEAGLLDSYDRQAQGRPNYGFDRRLDQVDARFERPAGDGLFALSGFARSWHVMNLADQAPAKPGVVLYRQEVPSNDLGAAVAWRQGDLDLEGDVRSVDGSAGQTGPTGLPQSSASGRQTDAGFGLQERVRGPRLEAIAGARLDAIVSRGSSTSFASPAPTTAAISSEYASAFSPRLAVRYDLSPNAALRASASGGFRAPFLNELLRSYTISGIRYQGNPALTPEHSRTLDAGLDLVSPGARLSLGFAHTVVSNAIAFVTLSPTVQQRSNLSQTQTDGVTLDAVRSLGACSRLRASAVAQYARVTNGSTGNLGKRLAYVPQQSASLGYEGRLGAGGMGLSLAYLGPTYADDLNLDPLGAALVAGIRLSAPLAGGASLTLSAENLADRLYRSTSDRLGPPAAVSLRWRVPLGAAAAPSPPGECLLP